MILFGGRLGDVLKTTADFEASGFVSVSAQAFTVTEARHFIIRGLC